MAKIFDISPRLVGEAIIEAFRSLSDYCRGMTPDRVFAPLSDAEGQDLRASVRFVRDWLDRAELRTWKSFNANNLIPPIDLCAMHARELIFKFAEETPREQWSELIAELRSQLDDIEKVLQPQGVRPSRFLSSVGYQQLNGAIGSINETVARLLGRRRR